MANMYSKIYRKVHELGKTIKITAGIKTAVREHFRKEAIGSWLGQLPRDNSPGVGIIKALGPHLFKWVTRKKGAMSYRMIQIFTGHGCLGKYLCRIGKEDNSECKQCGALLDSQTHILEECPSWTTQRERLVDIVGEDLSLKTIIGKMLEDENNWRAVYSFYEEVMNIKEEADRERENMGEKKRAPQRRRGRQ